MSCGVGEGELEGGGVAWGGPFSDERRLSRPIVGIGFSVG